MTDLELAMRIACPACAAQPGEPCREDYLPITHVHPERVDAALFKQSLSAPAGEGGAILPITDEDIEATGLV